VFFVSFVIQGLRPAQAYENRFFDLVVNPLVFPITAITRSPAKAAAQIRRASKCHRERAAIAGSRTIQIGEAHFAALCRCTLSQTPPGGSTFVENKRQTPIRQDSHKTVDGLFSRFLHAESRYFCPVIAGQEL